MDIKNFKNSDFPNSDDLEQLSKETVERILREEMSDIGQKLFISLTAKVTELDGIVNGLLGSKIALQEELNDSKIRISELENKVRALELKQNPENIPTLLDVFYKAAKAQKENSKRKTTKKKTTRKKKK
jgi:hypothetical protein